MIVPPPSTSSPPPPLSRLPAWLAREYVEILAMPMMRNYRLAIAEVEFSSSLISPAVGAKSFTWLSKSGPRKIRRLLEEVIREQRYTPRQIDVRLFSLADVRKAAEAK